MKISIKGFITSKESELYSDCADRYAVNAEHNKFAISDGVSKSFFPKFWAEFLVENFVKSKKIHENKFIQDCQEEWLEKVSEIVKKPNVKWFTSNAFQNKKPGLATFVGLEFLKDKRGLMWQAKSLGDSFLFYVPQKIKDFEKEIFKLSSKKDLVFDNFPDFFSSVGNKYKGKVKSTVLRKLEPGTFYLMTDALSEWFINEKKDAIDEIGKWKNQDDFEEFIKRERRSAKLGNDDSAILIINLIEDNENKITYTENEVSNIYDLASKQEHEIKKQIDKLEEKKRLEEETLNEEIQESTNSAEEDSNDNNIESNKTEISVENISSQEFKKIDEKKTPAETNSDGGKQGKSWIHSIEEGIDEKIIKPVTKLAVSFLPSQIDNEPMKKETSLPKEEEQYPEKKGSESKSKPVTEIKEEKQKPIETPEALSPKSGQVSKSKNITDKF
ncbi:hypothetical protein N8089_02365 [Flavobacteriales bacterium]|nr:hypothetical protein [Flavobacteriales bacterium]